MIAIEVRRDESGCYDAPGGRDCEEDWDEVRAEHDEVRLDDLLGWDPWERVARCVRHPDVEELTWHVPPECRGQTVEVAYAVDSEGIWRRTTDRSGPETTYEVADWEDLCECDLCSNPCEWCRGPVDPWNREPDVPPDRWRERGEVRWYFLREE